MAIKPLVLSSTSVKSIQIPKSVEILGSGCFSNCKSFSEIIFESNCSLTRIESYAFYDSAVTAVNVPGSVVIIGDFSFGRCLSLSRLGFVKDSELKELSSTAFSQGPLLVRFSLPVGARIVESIRDQGVPDYLPEHRRSRQLFVNRNLSDCVTGFEGYERVEDISQGSFNHVQRNHDRKTGVTLAVKSFPRFSRAGHDWDSLFIREIENLLQMNHPCIVSLIEYSMPTKDHPARLATLFVDGCSLSSVLISSPDWWTATAKSIVIVGIVIGMKYEDPFMPKASKYH
jgi:hypothetical protein